MDITSRILARFQHRIAQDHWKGKFIGRDARLRWDRNIWLLEELPQKGKKKLKTATFDNFDSRGWVGFDVYIPGNILREAKLSSSDNYETIKKKMQEAFDAAAEETISGMPPGEIEKSPNKWAWLREAKWSESDVHFLRVEPEDTEPFNAEGKDFSVKVKWTDFETYSPTSDFQQADPHYTLYSATAPASARKLYQILKANPNALKSVPWSDLSKWFEKNKINYETHFSQWH